eukprot:TRINITY_DN2754_c0_g3_i1.p1 TRINITY_DN2754_c0_g3~~TRINITY_DN2754_c0_g3_i1.p1  ORF type:complete len:370 (+),score=75.35 TRINITY_DN2754_c0_g3_i1:1083-2192(+)
MLALSLRSSSDQITFTTNATTSSFVSPKAGRATTYFMGGGSSPTLTQLQAGQELRVITYNVHGWEDADGVDNFDRVADLLQHQRADIVCLQEVKEESRKFPSGGTLEALAAKLKMDYVKAVAASPDPNEWTPELDVVLSRFPIHGKHITKLQVGRHQERVAAVAEFKFEVVSNNCSLPPSSAESSAPTTTTAANTMMMTTTTTQRRVAVVCTHLDHAFEKVRLAQLAQLHDFLKRLDLKEYILAGDFNSLYRDDFTPQDWDSLAQLRKRNVWEPPLTDVVQTLLDQGYQDSYWEHHKRLYRKQRRQQQHHHQSDHISTMIPKPQATCWANTRIDFVFLSRELRMKPSSYSRVYNRSSDHFPVAVDLKLR